MALRERMQAFRVYYSWMQTETISMEPFDELGVGRDGEYSDILGKPLYFCDVQ